MKTSETISKIAPAFLEAQKAITFASKDATNPHYKNKYADLPAVIDAIKPALNDAGIAYMQSPTPSDDGRFHLTTRLIHASGEWIEDTFVMPLVKQDPQAVGSAMTYARRYALAAITGLYQDDDDGNAGSGVQSKQEYKKPETAKGVSPAELKNHLSQIKGAKDMYSLKSVYGIAYAHVYSSDDKVAAEIILEAKDARKLELEKA